MSASDPVRVLIVDDDIQLLRSLQTQLRRDGLEVLTTSNGGQALPLAESFDPDVILLDLGMPPPDGMTVLTQLQQQAPSHQVIIFSAQGSTRAVVEALKCGAFWFLDKPCELGALRQIIQRAYERRWLSRKLAVLSEPSLMIGSSAPMRELRRTIDQLANDPVTVLITGESGTGKEVASREIHRLSARSDAPFLAFNCGSVPQTLIERELLGHERGAFTDAKERKVGLFEQAGRGTLLLDEVGTLPPGAQVALLRVVQERKVRRLGGNEEIKVNVRLVAATNLDLRQLVQEGGFREDLFYRLNVFHLHMPPLRDRVEDIPTLAMHLLRRLVQAEGGQHKRAARFSPEAMEALQRYPWPGNVRELENAIERAVVICDDVEILPSHLPERLRQPTQPLRTATGSLGAPDLSGLDWDQFREHLDHEHRRWLTALLARFQGNKARAAEDGAKMDRANFRKLLRKCGIE